MLTFANSRSDSRTTLQVSFLFAALLFSRGLLIAQTQCAKAFESVAQTVVKSGYATWESNINQAGCNVYKLELLPPAESVCPYTQAKKDAERHAYSASMDLARCLGEFPFPPNPSPAGCSAYEADQRKAALFNSHVQQLDVWNSCKAQGGVTVSGATTSGDGRPLQGVSIRFANGTRTESDAAGAYSVMLAPGHTGSARASLAGYTFDPKSRTYSNVRTDQSKQDYVGTPYTMTKLMASDRAAGDMFGYSVASEGDTLVIGAPGYQNRQGAVYVFRWLGGGWAQQAKLTASDPAPSAGFGVSVAISGDTIAVGASGITTSGTRCGSLTVGAAYIFVGSGASWRQQARLVGRSADKNDCYGSQVSLDRETLAVAAANAKAAAYLFTRSEGVWTERAELSGGIHVAVNGDTVVVGPKVYGRSGNGWIELATLAPSGSQANVLYSGLIALHGDTAALGVSASNAVWPFQRDNGYWMPEPPLNGAKSGDWFGAAIDFDSQRMVVGAPYEDLTAGSSGATVSNAGAVHLFDTTGVTPTEVMSLSLPKAMADEYFGYSVALNGDAVLTGAPSMGTTKQPGAVYVFGEPGSATPQRFPVSLQASPLDGGSVSASPAGSGYDAGTSVTISATSNAGYRFSRWSGDLTGSTNPATIKVDKALIITAVFEAIVATPNLAVTSVHAPTTAATGGMIAVSATVVNRGAAAAPSFRLKFYISTSPTITGASTDTGWGCTIKSLNPAASESCEGSIPLAASMKPGVYYVGASADAEGAVTDSDRSDNTRMSDTGPMDVRSPVQGARPVITSAVTATGFGGFERMAPGTWVEITGAKLARTTRMWTGNDFNGKTAPYSLDGVSVAVGGIPAFVEYVSPTQINVLLPQIADGSQPLVVSTTDGASDPFTVKIDATAGGLLAPAAFRIGGKQYVVATLADGNYALPTGAIAGVASRPAKPGEVVTLYGIGWGQVTPTSPIGQVAEAGTQILGPPAFLIDGKGATRQYAGLAPGTVGLYQFNITVPDIPDNDTALFACYRGLGLCEQSATQDGYLRIAVRR